MLGKNSVLAMPGDAPYTSEHMSKASAAVHDEVPKRAEVRALIESGDDFGHELRVGRILTAAGLRPTHGGTYVDPQTSKNREFDYRAAFWKNPGEVIRLAIECKNLRNSAPLIVCGLPRSRDDAYHHFVCANNGSSAATSAFMADIR